MAHPQTNPDGSNPAGASGEGEPISMDVIESSEGIDSVEGADEWDCFAGSGDEGEDKVSGLDNDSNNNPKKIEQFSIPRIIPRHGHTCKIQHSFGGLSPYYGRPVTSPYRVTVFEAPRMDVFLPSKGARTFPQSEVDACCDRSSSYFGGLKDFQVFQEVHLSRSIWECYHHSDRTLDNYVIKAVPAEILQSLDGKVGGDGELGPSEGDPGEPHEDSESNDHQDQPDQNMEVDEPEAQDNRESTSSSEGSTSASASSASKVPSVDLMSSLIPPIGAPAMTSDIIVVNNIALARPETDIIVSTVKTNLYQSDLATLRNGEDTRLTDPVIDFYLEMIQHRYPRTYAYQSALIVLLMEGDYDEGDNVDIFTYDRLFVPICHHEHWRLLVVNIRERTITSYNSLQHSHDTEFQEKLEVHVKSEQRKRYIPESDWRHFRAHVPFQDNGVDCGVFILQFASYICRGEAFTFGQENMAYFRERIIYECLRRELLQ